MDLLESIYPRTCGVLHVTNSIFLCSINLLPQLMVNLVRELVIHLEAKDFEGKTELTVCFKDFFTRELKFSSESPLPLGNSQKINHNIYFGSLGGLVGERVVSSSLVSHFSTILYFYFYFLGARNFLFNLCILDHCINCKTYKNIKCFHNCQKINHALWITDFNMIYMVVVITTRVLVMLRALWVFLMPRVKIGIPNCQGQILSPNHLVSCFKTK